MSRPNRLSKSNASVLWGLLLLAGVPLLAQAPPPDPAGLDRAGAAGAEWVEVGRKTGDGEQCLVCRLAIDGDEAVAIRYKGRTFHVKASMVDMFAEDPDRYFETLQARGALFDERAMEGRSVSPGWLIFGGYVLLGLICAALCGALAIGRGLEPLPWFFAGLVGNVAAVFVLLLGRRRGDAAAPEAWTKVRTTHAPGRCPACGAENHPSADACSGCDVRLEPTLQSEAVRA